MSDSKNAYDELVETIIQITTTMVAAKRCSPADGANLAREIINESLRVAQEMTVQVQSTEDARKAGAAMVQRQASRFQG